MRIQIQKALVTILISLALAHAAAADIYKYRTPDGKLVIGNRPPEGVTTTYERRDETPPAPVDDDPDRYRIKPTAVEPKRSYVDLHPLQIGSPRVQSTDVWWKKIVTGVVENRSGRTSTSAVLVEVDCGNYEGNDYVGSIPPRGRVRYSITVILDGYNPKNAPRLSCTAGATWTNHF